MALEKTLIAKTASLGLLALSLAVLPKICDNGCATLSKNEFERNAMDNIKYAQLNSVYTSTPTLQNYKIK